MCTTEEYVSSRAHWHAGSKFPFVCGDLVFFPGQPSTINLSVLRERVPRSVLSMSAIDGMFCEFEGNTEEIWSSRADVHAWLGGMFCR